VLEDGVTSIGERAFAGCSGLTTVIISETVTSVGTRAFYDCNLLSSVYYQGSTVILSSDVFTSHLEDLCVSPDYNNNATFCGERVTPNSTKCKAFHSLFSYCFKPEYQEGSWFQKKKNYARAWESRSNGCVEYICNESGLSSRVLQTCDDVPACHTGKCNEKTGKCEYKKVSGWDNMKKLENMCYEVSCVNDKWTLQLTYNASSWKNNSLGCVRYDCDNMTGNVKVLEPCETTESCYIAFCDEESSQCETKRINGYDELKKQENKCFEVACVGNEWVLQKTQNAISWEAQTDGCVKYECNNETGNIKTILSCDDAPPCFVGTCNEITAQCEYHEKDGLKELSKQENKCYEVVCDESSNEWSVQKRKNVTEWEDRRSKCRIFKCDNSSGLTSPTLTNCDQGPGCHTGKCNEESGECIYEKIDGYDELVKLENHCYEVACDGSKWILQKRDNATEWESQTDGCRQYQCHNETGPISWSMCNSSRTVGNKCVEGQCIPVVCPAGHYQFYGNCYNCSTTLSCATCSNATSCDSCIDGYYLTDQGICKRDCSIFGDGCTECNAKKCLNCTQQDCCARKDYYWNKTLNICQDPAEKFGTGCLKANEDQCTECTAVTCCDDRQFFDYSISSCDNCSKFGEECVECNSAGCLSCDGGKIVGTDSPNCMSCSEVYGDGCESCDQTKCSAAKSGFTVIGMVAKKCTDLFGEECSQCSPNGCDKCSEGYKSFEGYCKSCSEVFGEGCSECDTTMCTKCNSDSLILINGVCADCSTAYGEGCLECNSDSNCTKHDAGYFIFSGYSISCDVLPSDPPEIQVSCYTKQTNFVTSYLRQSIDQMLPRDVEEENEASTQIIYDNTPYTVYCSKIVENCNNCSSEEGSFKCYDCEDGYALFAGICKPCEEIHGKSCTKCSLSTCTECSDNNIAVFGVCHSCDSLNPHCASCSAADYCSQCEGNYIEKNGVCTTCQNLYGAGCSVCNATDCSECTEDACCPEDTQIIIKGEERSCMSCEELTEGCSNCTSTRCLSCKNGMVVDPDDSYKCKECSDLFFGCGSCTSDQCEACQNKEWLWTPNGCVHEEEIPEGEFPSSSIPTIISSSSSSVISSSKAIVDKSSSRPKNEGITIGAIIGIVVGAVVVAAVLAIAIYCVATKGPKHGKLDPSLYEEDEENSISMSVL